MKIGILGGTFNPIHLAHLRIAEEGADLCALDQVIFIPSATPPHKPEAGELPFHHRYAMVKLAVADNPQFTVSDMEQRRGGTSYLIDTLRQLRKEHPADDLYFILGSDSFRDLGNWRDYADYFPLCHLLVVERPTCRISDPMAALPVAIARDFCYDRGTGNLVHSSGSRIHFLTGTLLDIASSTLRQLVAEGKSIRYLVPETVRHYLEEQRLYADCT
ncbi:MAG TPA: nicotinate-nucleotide adenylyltransferase [Geobacterales bacterium]|nr:nicotinate-nucleotide adenylyltransferase [Geobacterales bacterium]